MEEINEMENRDAGNSPTEKYIHVNDIPTEKLDDDEDYKKSEGGKLPEKNVNTNLEEKTKKDQSQGNETVGIP
jgi:hypothetical protein